ncbi:MAG: rhamnogalacturonan acetylesterase [Treponema sp.]|nr:rhamnogalacturonan acetylesterase [Treponema sp.]
MRILCLGDSIMQYNDYTTFPQTGWVQELKRFFPEDTQWLNFARNGRSTKSFIDEGRFVLVMKEAQKGDIALIQFAHNDEKDDPSRHTDAGKDGSFRKNLAYFVRELRSKGVLPVLLTPVARRMFDGRTPVNSHGEYPGAIRETAAAEGVPCIDMTALTMKVLEKEGEAASGRFYMNFGAGLYENFPDGRDDNSHLRPDGAHVYSRLAAAEIAGIARTFPEYAVLSESCMKNTAGKFLETETQNEEIDDEFTVFQK